MRRLCCSWWLLAACAPQVTEPAQPVIASTRTTTSAGVCPQPGQPQALQLAAAVDFGEHAGKRWLLAKSDDGDALLLHLGSAGELLRTPLPRWTESVGAESPERLRMLASDDPPVWWTVDLRDPDAPQVSTPTPVELASNAFIKGFASDGAVALVSIYQRVGDTWQGATSLHRVPEGRPIGAPAPATVWTATCAGGRCYGWASPNVGVGRVLLALDDSGPRTLAELGDSGCSGAATWRDGERWIVAWSERAGVGLAAIDLASGALERGSISDTACPELEQLAVAGRHGLVVGPPAAQRWISVAADLRAGVPEPLPGTQHHRRRLASGEPGVFLAEWTTTRARVDNGIDPGGNHEWQDETSFRGHHGLLTPGLWQYRDGGPLPGDGELTVFGDEPDVLFLTRPGHAGLLTRGPGDAASYLRLHATCP